MANRRFEMFQYQQILFHMRSGESDRDLARSGVVGRRKAGEVRKEAIAQGWLDPARPLPSEAELARAFAQRSQPAGNGSSVAPYRAQIQAWVAEGIDGTNHPPRLGAQPRLHRQLLCGAAVCAVPAQ